MGCDNMKKIRNNRAKLERNRFSVFTDDLEHCYFCKRPKDDLHEILYGSNRLNSMRYGYVLPLCREHHNMFHSNQALTKEWAKKCQEHFEENHQVTWLDIFHKNYK